MSALSTTSDTTTPATLPGPRWAVGGARPTPPEDLPVTWQPTRRVREAEELARAVVTRPVSSERLCAIVAELQRDLGVDHAQVSVISDRQIAVVVDGQLADPDDLREDSDAGAVTMLENTLCVVAMRANRTVRIDDAAVDERVASTPPVVHGQIGSYLGSPIRTEPSTAAQPPAEPSSVVTTVGVLCVYHAQPHEWTRAEGEALDRAAVLVGDELRHIRRVAEGRAS